MYPGFPDSVVGGEGTLIRTLIQSLGFQAGVTGWAIYRNGNSEFNNGTFRGDVFVGSAANGEVEISTNVPVAVANHMTGLGGTIAQAWIGILDNNQGYLYIAEGQGANSRPVAAMGVINKLGNIKDAFTIIGADVPDTQSDVVKIGPSSRGVGIGLGTHSGGLGLNSPYTLLVSDFIYIFPGADLRYGTNVSNGSISMGRGRWLNGRFSGTPFSSTSTANETVMATTGTQSFKNGRAYEIHWYGNIDSANAQLVAIRIRENNLAGILVYNGPQLSTIAGGQDVYWQRSCIFVNTSGADITCAFALTFQAATVTATNLTGSGVDASYVTVDDIGEATAYAGYVSIT